MTTMTYGDYEFSPVPLVNISRDSLQVGNRTNPINHSFKMTLNGTLTYLPGNGGIVEVDDLMDELREAFDRDGKLLEIKCDSDIIMQIYPKIVSLIFNESNNNWVQTCPYTIEIEYCYDDLNEHPSGEVPPYIKEYNEEWNMEFVDDHKHFTWDLSSLSNQNSGSNYNSVDQNNPFEARVTHTITAIGKQSWQGPGLTGDSTNAADNAMDWLNTISNSYGYDSTVFGHSISGWNNLTTSDYTPLDHIRTHVVNETDGSVTLTESWIIVGNQSGLLPAERKITEDFSVSLRRGIDDGRVNVSVEGSLKGYEERSYTSGSASPVTEAAYDNASTAWAKIQDRVFPRAQFIFQQDFSSLLNPTPRNRVIGHQPSKGVITYSYEFDDRPCAFISGALSENFSIIDNHPSDVFAKLPVLGRIQGPVLQEITTVTESSRDISIEAVMPSPTGCSSIEDLDLNKPTENVENLLCQFETQLTDSYDQVFKQSDVENWNPTTGRYSRNVSWVYQDCDTAPSTSFC